MRKNRMMRLASALLILTMVTTCAISGTFAKYVTSDTATDSARVAKWGVVVDVYGTDAAVEEIFGEDYNDAIVSGGTKVVSAVDGEDIVAPGTNGTLGTIKITGKPEVVVDVTADVNLEISDWVIDTDTKYFPIVIKVNNNAVTYAIDADAETIEAAVEEAMIKAILTGFSGTDVITGPAGDTTKGSACTKQYAANNDFGTNADPDVTVTWWWPFEGSETGALTGQDDASDTKLGNLATAPTITFTYTVTATQVD